MEQEKANEITLITADLSKHFYKKLFEYMESIIKENRQYSNEILHISSHIASKALFTNIMCNMLLAMKKEKREVCLNKELSELKHEIIDVINKIENTDNHEQ